MVNKWGQTKVSNIVQSMMGPMLIMIGFEHLLEQKYTLKNLNISRQDVFFIFQGKFRLVTVTIVRSCVTSFNQWLALGKLPILHPCIRLAQKHVIVRRISQPEGQSTRQIKLIHIMMERQKILLQVFVLFHLSESFGTFCLQHVSLYFVS